MPTLGTPITRIQPSALPAGEVQGIVLRELTALAIRKRLDTERIVDDR